MATLKKQLADTEASKGKDHADLIPILTEISKSYREQGAYVPALPFAQRALDLARKAHSQDQDNIEIAGQLDYVGTLYHLQGDSKSAVDTYRQVLAIVEKKLGTDHPAYATIATNFAIACLALGNTSEAEGALDKAMATALKVYGAAAQPVTDVQGVMGELYLRTGRFAKAEQLFVYALTVRSEGLEAPVMAGATTEADVLLYMAPVRNELGRLYTIVGLYDKADPLLHDALKAYETKLGKDHPQLQEVLVNLVALSQATGKTEQAAAFQKRADEIYEKTSGVSHPAGSAKPKAIEASLPPASGIRLYAGTRVGDWVEYEGPQGMPVSKTEVVKKTSLVVVVARSTWDRGKKEWQTADEELADLSGGVESSYGIAESSLKAEKAKIKEQEVACSTALVTQEGKQCKIYLAPEIVPVGGLVKIVCDGEVIMQAAGYQRGK